LEIKKLCVVSIINTVLLNIDTPYACIFISDCQDVRIAHYNEMLIATLNLDFIQKEPRETITFSTNDAKSILKFIQVLYPYILKIVIQYSNKYKFMADDIVLAIEHIVSNDDKSNTYGGHIYKTIINTYQDTAIIGSGF
jgi:hypothetical protein